MVWLWIAGKNNTPQTTEAAAITVDVRNGIQGLFAISAAPTGGAISSVVKITAVIWEKTVVLVHASLANSISSNLGVTIPLFSRGNTSHS